MPYEIRGKCIYRKDTGEKVGCTKGDVHKYMAALLANTHESVQEESLRKYIRKVLSENVINEDFDSVKEIKEFANQILIYAAKTNVDYVKKQLKEGLNLLFYPVSILEVYQQEPKNFTSIADFITNSNVWVRFRPSKNQKVRGNYSVYDEPYNRERVRTINLFYDDSALTIELSEKNKEREMEYNDLYFSFWYKFASTLEHELQHAFDDFRSNSKLFSTKKAKKFIASDYADDTETDYKKNALKHKQYLNLQHEIWARFTQAVSKTRFTGIDFKGDYIVYHMKPLDDVLKSFRYEFEGWQLLSDNMKKKLMSKVSQFWHKEQDLIPEKNKKELERVANKKEANVELTEEISDFNSKIPDLVRLLTRKYEQEYGVSCDLINQGDCSNFAEELYDMLKEIGINSEILSDGLFYDPFDEDSETWDASEYGKVPINFKEVGLPSHYWIFANGKHYDSDAPEGVSDMFQLPIIKNFYNKHSKKIKESTNFTDEAEPFGYGYDTSAFPPKVFQDKSGEKYMIYIHDWGVGNKEYYVIVATTLGEPIPGRDRYGKQGRHIRGERVGALWLQECEDGIYRSTPTRSDGLWVREDKRRQGIATAMHDYANQILGLKTDISSVTSQDAKDFWKNRKSSLAEDEIKVPEIPNTMTFWHGGNLDNYDDIIAQKNGRYEWGAGLYLITKYDVAIKYAKGSRKLYIVTVENGVDINDAFIDIDKAKQFVDTYVLKHLRKEIWERISNPKFVVDGKIVAYAFNNIILNEKAIKSTNTQYLRAFYVSNGIDYEIVDNPFGWGEKMMVLYNMNKIVNTIQVKSGDKISDYEMLNPNKGINEVVVGEDEENTEMISGIIDLLCQVKDMNNRKQMVIDQINGLRGEGIDINPKEFARRCGFSEDILNK